VARPRTSAVTGRPAERLLLTEGAAAAAGECPHYTGSASAPPRSGTSAYLTYARRASTGQQRAAARPWGLTARAGPMRALAVSWWRALTFRSPAPAGPVCWRRSACGRRRAPQAVQPCPDPSSAVEAWDVPCAGPLARSVGQPRRHPPAPARGRWPRAPPPCSGPA